MKKYLVLIGAVLAMSMFLAGCQKSNVTGGAAQLSPASELANPDFDTAGEGSWKCYDLLHRGYQSSDGAWNQETITFCRNGMCGTGGECCVNDCRYTGEKICSNSYAKVCGEYDAEKGERVDPCLEWSPSKSCENGCFNGYCRA